MPGGVPYIIGNELAERYSFYGMKGLLVVFMTTQLMGPDGQPAPMSEADASGWYHTFT
jgi:POT family proton-dependent oligopeptide transporter